MAAILYFDNMAAP